MASIERLARRNKLWLRVYDEDGKIIPDSQLPGDEPPEVTYEGGKSPVKTEAANCHPNQA